MRNKLYAEVTINEYIDSSFIRQVTDSRHNIEIVILNRVMNDLNNS